MEHVYIFFHVISLLIGVWAVFYCDQNRKIYKFSFLKHLELYVIFLNLTLFFYLFSKYIYANLWNSDLSNASPLLIIITVLLAFSFELGIVYEFVLIIFTLKGKEQIIKINRMFIGILSIFIFSFVIGIIKYNQYSSYEWILGTYRGLVVFAYIICCIMLFSLLIYAKKQPNKNKKRAFFTFGIFYFLGYFLPFINFILPEPFELYIISVFLIVMNVIPIIWIKYYFLKYFAAGLSSNGEKEILELICKDFGVSNREIEIIQQLLDGKSNKEIEDILFISFNTVKNHIYNIYQKLGVNSRGQLLHFIKNYQNN